MEAVRKRSKKRDAILCALQETKEHPSAEMLYETLKPLYPDLSLGTVYRNLSLFLDSGEIVCVGNVNGQDRYDADTSAHAHFVCTGCNRVVDLALADQLTGLYEDVESEIGCEVWSHSLTFSGSCRDCKEKASH